MSYGGAPYGGGVGLLEPESEPPPPGGGAFLGSGVAPSMFAGTMYASLLLLDEEPSLLHGPLARERGELRLVEHRTLAESLVLPHSVRVSVAVLNLDGDHLSHLDPVWVDGQVDVALGAESDRALTMTIFDPDHELNMDSESPSDGSLYRDRMLRVTYGIRVDALDDHWVDVPVFVGPLIKWDRSRDEVSVEAHSKEVLAQRGAQGSNRLPRKARRDSAIRKLMAERTGETRFDLAESNGRLHRPMSLKATDKTWPKVQKIAHAADKQLFYTAGGVLRMRRWPDNASFTFTDDHLLGPITVSDVPENVVNRVTVIGRKPRSSKNREDDDEKRGGGGKPRGQATLPRRHPLSGHNLGRQGAPSYLDFTETNEHVRSDREGNRRARRLLADKSDQVKAISFDAMPVPFLEPGDLVRVRSDTTGFELKFRLREFSLPLSVGEGEGAPMSIGARKKVSGSRRRGF